MKKIILVAFLLFVTSQAYSSTVSFDQLAVSSDLTATKYNTDLNTIFQKVNSGIDTTNISSATLTEPDFADEINPRVRTAEGAVCSGFVYTGLLMPTTSGTLTGTIPTGTAYPLGYRVVKSSTTPKTFTGSRWTWVDLDINGSFTYSEASIGGSTPAIAPNSTRLFLASSDTTQVNTVTDLRTTSCTNGPFSVISNEAGGASLGSVLGFGRHNRVSGDIGWAQGLQVSYDTITTFKVRSGSAYIGGKYRAISTDTTVPQTTDNPTNGISGLDTGAIASGTRYTVFATADQDGASTPSFTFSTSESAPTGVTAYRKIGSIKTDASSKFASYDVMTAHEINQKEILGAWVNFKAVGTTTILKSYNVSALTDNGTGDTTVSFERPFATSSDYVVAGVARRSTGGGGYLAYDESNAPTSGSVRLETWNNNGGAVEDMELVSVIAAGERP